MVSRGVHRIGWPSITAGPPEPQEGTGGDPIALSKGGGRGTSRGRKISMRRTFFVLSTAVFRLLAFFVLSTAPFSVFGAPPPKPASKPE